MSDLDVMVTRMKAQGATRVYKFGEVPASPGSHYAVLTLDRGRATNRRSDTSTSRAYRLVAQIFAPTTDALYSYADRADAAFDNVTLTELDGSPRIAREEGFAPPMTRDPDGEVLLYTLQTYVY